MERPANSILAAFKNLEATSTSLMLSGLMGGESSDSERSANCERLLRTRVIIALISLTHSIAEAAENHEAEIKSDSVEELESAAQAFLSCFIEEKLGGSDGTISFKNHSCWADSLSAIFVPWFDFSETWFSQRQRKASYDRIRFPATCGRQRFSASLHSLLDCWSRALCYIQTQLCKATFRVFWLGNFAVDNPIGVRIESILGGCFGTLFRVHGNSADIDRPSKSILSSTTNSGPNSNK